MIINHFVFQHENLTKEYGHLSAVPGR